MKDTVVTFKNETRSIAMYFSELEDGGLDMQMSITPEFDPEKEQPDLPMLLASTLMNALNTETADDSRTSVYAGED